MAKMTLKEGCPGCGRKWGEGEGQCSRCKRCLECCGHENVEHSCAAKWVKKNPDQRARSTAAYERWANNVNVLGGQGNRRIT